jgi:hypothetical protein
MILFALDPWWNDFYAAGGFWLGVAGTIIGVAGFAIAIYQIVEAKRATRDAKTAAEAARDAANQTLAESKDAFERFVAAHAGRILSELEGAVRAADWNVAEMRCRDMADLIATLPATGNTATDDKMIEAVKQLREFGHTYADLGAREAKRLPPGVTKTQWKPLLQVLNARLDQLRAPFREHNDGQRSSDDPSRATPADRSTPPHEDESRSGELDA